MTDKVLNMLGIAMRAGKLISGADMAVDSIRAGKAKAAIAAGDASENSKKMLRDKCSFYKVPYYEYSDKGSLGRAIGKEERAILVIEDENLASAVIKLLA